MGTHHEPKPARVLSPARAGTAVSAAPIELAEQEAPPDL